MQLKVETFVSGQSIYLFAVLTTLLQIGVRGKLLSTWIVNCIKEIQQPRLYSYDNFNKTKLFKKTICLERLTNY